MILNFESIKYFMCINWMIIDKQSGRPDASGISVGASGISVGGELPISVFPVRDKMSITTP